MGHCFTRHPRGKYTAWHWACYTQLPACCPQETLIHPCCAVARHIVSSQYSPASFSPISLSTLTLTLALSLSATSKLIYSIMSHTSSHASSPQRTHVYLSKLVSWNPVSLSLKQEWSNHPRWRKITKFKNVLHRKSFSSLFSFAQLLIRQGFAKLNFVHILASFAHITTILLLTMRLLGSCCWL